MCNHWKMCLVGSSDTLFCPCSQVFFFKKVSLKCDQAADFELWGLFSVVSCCFLSVWSPSQDMNGCTVCAELS